MAIKFGTDGWRGIIAEDFTFENVRLCAQGAVDLLKAQGLAGQGLVVGYDTRFASDRFAATVAEVAAASGVDTLLCDRPCPTPAVSFAVVSRQAGGGVAITASHNAAGWNGFKFKPDYGGSASAEVVADLERHIAAAAASGGPGGIPLADAVESGAVELFDPEPDVPGASRRARRRRCDQERRAQSRDRRHARRRRRIPAASDLRRRDQGDRDTRRAQPRIPRNGAARADRAQSRAARLRRAGRRRRRRPCHRRRRRPPGRRRRAGTLRDDAADVRAPVPPPARGARQPRAAGALHHDDRHGGPARRAVRRPRVRHACGLQAHRPGHDASRTP